jgi:hypothetical protein
MSGGTFEYAQYKIGEIADEIEQKIERQGKKIPEKYLGCDPDYYLKYPEELVYETYPKEVSDKLKEAVRALRVAHVYAQRADWFFAGDDGEESFLKRLKEELEEIK